MRLANSDGVSVGAASAVNNNAIGGTTPAARNVISGNHSLESSSWATQRRTGSKHDRSGEFHWDQCGRHIRPAELCWNQSHVRDVWDDDRRPQRWGRKSNLREISSRESIGGGQNGCSGSGTDATTSTGNVVRGNRIGTDVTGSLPLGNGPTASQLVQPVPPPSSAVPPRRRQHHRLQRSERRGSSSFARHHPVQFDFFQRPVGYPPWGNGVQSNAERCRRRRHGAEQLTKLPGGQLGIDNGSSLSVQYAVPSTTAIRAIRCELNSSS